MFCDFVLKGDGYVEREIMSDLSLRASIQSEGTEYVQFLSNRARIFLLTFVDVVNGKRNMWDHQKENVVDVTCHESEAVQTENNSEPDGLPVAVGTRLDGLDIPVDLTDSTATDQDHTQE